jgi:ribonuclease HI
MSISPKVGHRVGDSDTSDDDSAIIVGISNKTAGEYIVESQGKTVKELNPQCSSDERVILVSFESHLEKVIPNWAFLDSQKLTQKVMTQDVNKYAYPESRLFHINDGLMNGVTINISGVAHPINQTSGAYSYNIESDEEVIHTESKIVEYGGSYVGKNTAIYEGLISALKWINKNNAVPGVVIRTEDKVVVNQMNGEYEVQDSGNEMLFYELMNLIDNMDYHVVHMEPKYNQEQLIENARETYKNSTAIEQ